MTTTLEIGNPDKSSQYDALADSHIFSGVMNSLRGSTHIISYGRDSITGFTKEIVYHVTPENVTVHYQYENLGRANIDIHGSNSSKFKKRLENIVKRD